MRFAVNKQQFQSAIHSSSGAFTFDWMRVTFWATVWSEFVCDSAYHTIVSISPDRFVFVPDFVEILFSSFLFRRTIAYNSLDTQKYRRNAKIDCVMRNMWAFNEWIRWKRYTENMRARKIRAQMQNVCRFCVAYFGTVLSKNMFGTCSQQFSWQVIIIDKYKVVYSSIFSLCTDHLDIPIEQISCMKTKQKWNTCFNHDFPGLFNHLFRYWFVKRIFLFWLQVQLSNRASIYSFFFLP